MPDLPQRVTRRRQASAWHSADRTVALVRPAGPGRTSGPDHSNAAETCQPAPAESDPRLAADAAVADSGSELRDIDRAAVAAYRVSVEKGKPLSERKLAAMFGKTSRRWARNRMAEAVGNVT